MNANVRSALVGGLAATFVVAAAFAPKLLSRPSEVKVHNSSTDSALVESTTTLAPETTTTEAPTTTTTKAPVVVATTMPPTTTTTTVERVWAGPPNVGCNPTTADGSQISCVVNPIGPFQPNPKPSVTKRQFPNFRIRIAVSNAGEPRELSIPAPADGGLFPYSLTPGDQFTAVVAVDWDGGSAAPSGRPLVTD